MEVLRHLQMSQARGDHVWDDMRRTDRAFSDGVTSGNEASVSSISSPNSSRAGAHNARPHRMSYASQHTQYNKALHGWHKQIITSALGTLVWCFPFTSVLVWSCFHNFTPQLRYTVLCVCFFLSRSVCKNYLSAFYFCDVFGRSLVWLYVETEDMSVISFHIYPQKMANLRLKMKFLWHNANSLEL